jgi:hypothetical protein
MCVRAHWTGGGSLLSATTRCPRWTWSACSACTRLGRDAACRQRRRRPTRHGAHARVHAGQHIAQLARAAPARLRPAHGGLEVRTSAAAGRRSDRLMQVYAPSLAHSQLLPHAAQGPLPVRRRRAPWRGCHGRGGPQLRERDPLRQVPLVKWWAISPVAASDFAMHAISPDGHTSTAGAHMCSLCAGSTRPRGIVGHGSLELVTHDTALDSIALAHEEHAAAPPPALAARAGRRGSARSRLERAQRGRDLVHPARHSSITTTVDTQNSARTGPAKLTS